jgi:hypothetical protein
MAHGEDQQARDWALETVGDQEGLKKDVHQSAMNAFSGIARYRVCPYNLRNYRLISVEAHVVTQTRFLNSEVV